MRTRLFVGWLRRDTDAGISNRTCRDGDATCLTRDGDLSTCDGHRPPCDGDLPTCDDDLFACDSDLSTCDHDVSARDGDSGTRDNDNRSQRLTTNHQPSTTNATEERHLMRQVDTLRYEMLVRVRDFGVAQADTFSASSLGGQMFAQVNSAVLQLGQQAATQVSGHGAARGGTSTKAVAREALRDQLEAISRTARALAIETPGVAEKFTMPQKHGDQRLLNTARAFAQDAAPLASSFIAHAMPENFLDGLNTSIANFEQAMHDRDAGRGRHMAARASIDAALDAGLTAVLRLDAIVPNQLRNDPVTATVWERIRRVARMPSRATGESAPAPTPTATPTAGAGGAATT